MKSPLILRVFKDGQLLEVKQFDLEQIVIGRNAEVQLDLNHETVASIHSLIELRDNGYYICDLGSQSGTFLNGKSILDEAILSGDEIQIGPFKIVFFVGVPKPKAALPDSSLVVLKSVPSTPVESTPVVASTTETVVSSPVVEKIVPKIEPKVEFQPSPEVKVSIQSEVKVQEPVIPASQVVPKVSASIPSMEASMTAGGGLEKPVIRKTSKVSVPFKKVKTGKTFAPQSEVQDFDFLIQDLYPLTGVAKAVDEEIESNTWTFTRENLMTYFEALGCTATNGGKHKKVSLPKALIISYEGSTITILNELGGALTLPRWDGSEGNGQAPSYLRSQILKAREKLILLKVKVNNATSATSY